MSDDGTAYTTVSNPFGSVASPATFGDYTITNSPVTSNSPGTSSLADEFGADLVITKSSSSTQHLFIKLGDTGFTAPTTLPSIAMTSNVVGTVAVSDPSNTLTFQSYVDPANGQNSTTGSTTGPESPNITVASTDLPFLENIGVEVKNHNSSIGTLSIKLSDSSFTAKTTPQGDILISRIGGSVSVGGQDHTLNDPSFVAYLDGQVFTAGSWVPRLTGNPEAQSSENSTWITRDLMGLSAVSEFFKIILNPSGRIGYHFRNNLSAVPEPSGLVLAGFGALVLTGYFTRQRQPGVRESCPANDGAKGKSRGGWAST